jgi:dTDP-4-dehydrorhamnose reductase
MPCGTPTRETIRCSRASSSTRSPRSASRWLTLDLLTGRVTPGHPLWSYLSRAGLRPELEELASDPCPPDIVGLDYYPPSERFLDDRIERYPARTHASNGRHRYADLDAVRVLADGPTGFERLALGAWRRYRLPLAATEVHLGCTREEQLRWLGIDMQAALQLAVARSYGLSVLSDLLPAAEAGVVEALCQRGAT